VQKIVIKIVIEIGVEQTWLFQCDRFHYADFVIEIVIDFQNKHSCSKKILTEIDKNPPENEHGYFNVISPVQKIGRAQADFFPVVTLTNQY